MIAALVPATCLCNPALSKPLAMSKLGGQEAARIIDFHAGSRAFALESNPFAAAPMRRHEDVEVPSATAGPMRRLEQEAAPGATAGPGQGEKQELIGRLLGRFTQPEHAALVRDALSVYSTDNLRLAADSGVTISVLSLADMPRICAGVEVQKHFMMGRDHLMSWLVDIVSRRTGEFPLPGENETAWVRKEIVKHRIPVTWAGADDVGGDETIDFTKPDDVYNVSTLAGLTAVEATTGERAIFIPSHQPARGAIIHEMAHALDTLKHPAGTQETPSLLERASQFVSGLLGEGAPQAPASAPLTWSSEQDRELVRHFHDYVDQTRAWPGRQWSHYAASGDVTEYLAEAVRMWGEHPDQLRAADPELCDFARQFATQEAYPEVHFTVGATVAGQMGESAPLPDC